jgi:hypothetical protein
MSERAPGHGERAVNEPEPLSREAKLRALIERANVEYRSGLDEAAAFQRLSQRLEPPRRRALSWPRVALGVAFSAAVVAVIELPRRQSPPLALGPDIISGRRSERNPAELGSATPRAASDVGAGDDRADDDERELALDDRDDALVAPETDAVGATGLSADRALEASEARVGRLDAPSDVAPRAGEARVTSDSWPPLRTNVGALREGSASNADPRESERVAEEREPRSEPARVGPRGAAATTVAPTSMAPTSVARALDERVDCLHIARQGEPRAAERCFAERAAGSGLSAEMALYDMARLRRDVLRDGDGALRALDDYRQRFPEGSLRHEVSITRVDLLADLGRSREALNESETLLGSASGQERAAELHMLRGNVFRRHLADPASAAREYAKAEQLGGALSAEATRQQGLSLEATGDLHGALAAYRRYLARGDGLRQAEVTRRVEALTAAVATSAGAARADGSAGADGTGTSRDRRP